MMNDKKKPPLITPTWRFICQHPAYFLAFGFGSGLSKWAPGTMGSLIAVPLYWLLSLFLSPLLIVVLSVVMFFIGIRAAEKTGQLLGVHDYGGIVIDEIVAMWLCLAIAPQTWPGFLVTFILFRIFDILKPWPIGWFDRRVSGGLGVMLDDLIAAVFVIAILLVWRFAV